ncbi:MAG: hypothetical protein M0Z81_02840 [Deltaproteobacteria bacterium]|nr:hypothetical protein [Deltaproteobacteria bacterium]
MPFSKLSQHGSHIVLIGDFNPKIFQPAWFGAQDLIRQSEVEDATIQIVSSEIVIFTLDWLRLEVTRERFSAGTTQDPYHPFIMELVLGTFRLLRHTPLRMMGINREAHYKMNSEERWHAIGHKLVPKKMWEGLLTKPGMASLTVSGIRPDSHKGSILVTIEPSMQFRPGIYVRVNDHFESSLVQSASGADEIIDILAANWKESYDRASGIITKLMEEADNAQ